DVGGLAGWQWLFLLEGVPAVVLGFVVPGVLTERPEDAMWLTASERATLVAGLRDEQTTESTAGTAWDAFRLPRTWMLAVVYFTIPVTLYGIGFWMPRMLKDASGASDFTVGLLSAIPYAAGAIAMVLVGQHSDR